MNHIAILLTSSPADEDILDHGIQLARALQTDLTLIRIIEQPVSQSLFQAQDPVNWHLAKVEFEANLQKQVEEVRLANVDVQASLREGATADILIPYLHENPMDLLIIPEQNEIISEATYRLLTHLETPLLIIRHDGQHTLSSPFAPYRRILVPVDGSSRAEFVLPLVTQIARPWDATLWLVHIVHKPETPRQTPLAAEDQALVDKLTQRNLEEATTYLAQLAEQVDAEVTTRVLVSDNVAAALHDLTEKEHPDLIALSAHGYSAKSEWPYGSIASNLIAFGRIPILVVQDLPADYHSQVQIPRSQVGVE